MSQHHDDRTERYMILHNKTESRDRKEIAAYLKKRYTILHAITAGDHTLSEERAAFVMAAAQRTHDLAEILTDDCAVYQLARNGQAKAVWTALQSFTPKQQAKILAADEALFGLLHYGPEQGIPAQDVADMVFALPSDLQKDVMDSPKDGNAIGRNGFLLQNFTPSVVKTEKPQAQKTAGTPAPAMAAALA